MPRRKRTLDEFIAGSKYWQGHCIDIEDVDSDAMDMRVYFIDLEEFLLGLRDAR